MNKTKFLIFIIILLSISNIFLLFLHVNRPRPEETPRKLIIEKLHFNDEQTKKYDVYIKNHQKSILENEKLMNEYRNELYQELNKKQDTEKINSIIRKIGVQQQTAEKIHYHHFIKIKSLCTPSQEKYFVDLAKELSQLFSKNRDRHPPKN